MSLHKLPENRLFVWYGPASVSARRTRSAALLAGVCAALLLAAGSPAAAGPGSRVGSLRAQQDALAGRLHSATLDIYALDSHLAAARATLMGLRAKAAELRAQQLELAQQIGATQRTLVISQRHLSDNLRMLYEQGDTDPLAVILGAESLNAAASSRSTGGRTLVVSSTGYSLPGHTATGLPVGFGIVAVDPTVIPLGTRMTIPGYGEGVAADVGSGIRGATIDLWFPTLAQALAWGRRTVTITLH